MKFPEPVALGLALDTVFFASQEPPTMTEPIAMVGIALTMGLSLGLFDPLLRRWPRAMAFFESHEFAVFAIVFWLVVGLLYRLFR